MNPLFACSRCFKRYPFEEIFTTTSNDMFCGDCRNATAKSKCTYCRSEYQQTGKQPSTHSACPKCQAHLKLGLKPKPCVLCSINAAFKSEKCMRCTSSEYKYGPAVKCEICQQTCAFNREDHKIDGKLHCWLCKLSYKRALAKAKKSETDKYRHKKRSADEAALKTNPSSHKMSNSGSSNNRSSGGSQRPDLSKAGLNEIPEKIPKTGNSGMIPTNSDQSNYVTAITQLREQIATLQKKLQQKDNHLLQKDKEITEWKGKHFTIENENRNRMKEQEKVFDAKLDVLNKRVQMQLKEIAQLSRTQKRNERVAMKESAKIEKDSQNSQNSSDNDSPSTN